MCGIAGIVGGRRHAVDIHDMLNALRHRGPDDVGVWSDEHATLGQRRLSIIDLAGGHQPLHNEDESLWVVCNGEIYNYLALREDLIRKGYRFLTGSDCEVILHLYAEYGARCLEHMRGMFAFALWDVRKRTLFAARDHLGQKPLYYAEHQGRLLFASEIKAIVAAEPALRQLDPEALDQYLALRVIGSPRSMFAGVRKLPPGHWLRFAEASGLEIGRYWDLSYEPKLEGSDEELTDRLEQELIEALRLHMVSDVPVGAFMSGGMDSTLLVAMLMTHVTDTPIPTFTLSLPHEKFNEGPFARLVAERYGTEHHEEQVTPSLVSLLPKMVWHLDEPSDPLSL
ncbi:MAG: asparagine synthase (glutamine-hydrolyzing), partial [Gammaproteobacteria bacterium]